MKIIIATFSLVFTVFFSYTQVWKEYLFTEEMEEKYAKNANSSEAYSFVLQSSFLNEYQKSLEWYAVYYPKQPILKAEKDSILQTFHAVPARENILKSVESQNFVLFSHAVQIPTQRVFLTSLLPDLWKKGFRHLGVENMYVDTLKGTVHLTDTLGYYLREPSFFTLVKTALDLGFTIFSYGTSDRDFDKGIQTEPYEKVIAYAANYSDEKILVLCNEYELQKNPADSTETIASALGKTNLPPYTINQTFFVEQAADSLNFQVTNTAQEPILLSNDTLEFKGFTENNPIADKLVVLPKWETYKQSMALPAPNFTIPHKRFIAYPAFLMVFPKNDFTDNSLPFAIKEIRTKEDDTSFYLPKGEYSFLFLYQDREIYHTLNVILTK